MSEILSVRIEVRQVKIDSRVTAEQDIWLTFMFLSLYNLQLFFSICNWYFFYVYALFNTSY